MASILNGIASAAAGLGDFSANAISDEANKRASIMAVAPDSTQPAAPTASASVIPTAAAPPAPSDGGLPPEVKAAIGRGVNSIAGLPKDQALAAIVQRESGGKNIPTAIMGPDGKPASTASGYYQMLDGTWQEAASLAGLKDAPARAMLASRADQDAAASALWDKYGYKPWMLTSASSGAS